MHVLIHGNKRLIKREKDRSKAGDVQIGYLGVEGYNSR